MKTQLLRTSILALAVAAGAYAQCAQQFQAKVPFDFIAGKQTLSAGQYTVDQRTAPGRVILKPADHKSGAIVMVNALRSTGAQKDAKLVFHRYGSRYFLAEVWVSASDSGYQVPTSRVEQELATRQPVPDSVIILASR
jgi:hypothetical protein